MAINISDILPMNSLDGAAFLFGAGASKEAGYPLVTDLTRSVLRSLTPAETALLIRTLNAESVTHDLPNGLPDIESLADTIIKHRISTSSTDLLGLEEKFRTEIARQIQNVKEPNLSHHVKFLSALKRRCGGNPTHIWVFTTNYDPLFELAATETGVRLVNGFQGTLTRFFCPESYAWHQGEVLTVNRFKPLSGLTIVLVKLHGSICWGRGKSSVIESVSVLGEPLEQRVIILPRRLKVFDTLSPPYDALFRYSASVLGARCKFLACSGFGFKDQHIYDALISPKLEQGALRVFATFGEEIDSRSDLVQTRGFNFSTPTKVCLNGVVNEEANDLWKFSAFVKLFD